MEISNWVLAVSNKTEEGATLSDPKEVEPLPTEHKSPISKVDALAKLQELKSSGSQLKETAAVLTTFSKDEISSQLFNDVLLALEMTIDKLQYIAPSQLSDYKGYPLALIKGEQVSFEKLQLVTPNVKQLELKPNIKKRLWNTLQIAKANL